MELIHPNPATGKAYTDIRKQWKRLLATAERMLGYKLTGKQSEFFNFRNSGASHIAARARDVKHIAAGVLPLGSASTVSAGTRCRMSPHRPKVEHQRRDAN